MKRVFKISSAIALLPLVITGLVGLAFWVVFEFCMEIVDGKMRQGVCGQK